jgi:ABC-type transport system substrate-binding protein
VYGSTAGAWWIYMNQTQEPFSNIHVRKAVVHAINYDEIISVAFGGRANKWVGPVPPGYPYYNPQNLTPYAYNLALAMQEMNLSKWPLSTGGYPNTINYEYLNLGDWGTVAQLLVQDLAKIGLKINPVAISLETLIAEQKIDPSTGKCTAQEAKNGGPFPIGQEFYTSDYIAPDDWTQNNAVSTGSANQCMAGYSNMTMDGLVYGAAGESNAANLTADYTAITQMMYDNYTNAWLVTPLQFQVYNTHLHGAIPNPMGSALPFTMLFNTEYADNTVA